MLTTDRLHVSEVAMVLGLSPYGGPWDVWNRRFTPPVEKDDKVLTRGRYLERAVCDWYEDHAEGPVHLLSPSEWSGLPMPLDGPYPITGTMDRIALFPTRGPARVLEAKTSRSKDGWGTPGTDEIPMFYASQGQLYLAITGLDVCDFAVLFTLSEEFEIYRLESNATIQDELIRRSRDWWHRFIVGGEQPPVDGSSGCSDGIEALFPRHSPPLRQASVSEADLVQRIVGIKAEFKSAQQELDAYENRLKAAIGEAEGLQWGGLKATWKSQERTTVDTKALRSAHPDIAQKFERTSSFRVLRVSSKED